MNKFTQKRMVSIVLAILLLLPLEPSGVFAATTVQANPTSSSVLVNGMKVSFEAYNINNNNYFKLRDLGSSVNFGVAFDPKANSIIIDTSMGYKAGAVIVTMSDFKFMPGIISISKGDTVIWKNTDSAGHDVSVSGITSPIFGNGQTFSFTFNETGTFDYFCTVHPTMTGQVVVK